MQMQSRLDSAGSGADRSDEAKGQAGLSSDGNIVILLRSGWQSVNIGDIAHTPGVLRLLERFVPQASVILWPNDLDMGVEELLLRRFPKLRIVKRSARREGGGADVPYVSLEQAFAEADLFLHGSSATVKSRDLVNWHEKTGKPYGLFGVTIGCPIGSTDDKAHFETDTIQALQGAAFVFTRETRSKAEVEKLGLNISHLEFVPDGTFALDLANEEKAESTLRALGLEPDAFICVVPRLRFSPYWDMFPERAFPPGQVEYRKAVNERFAEKDHAKLRRMIETWVRETGLKVLLCPEMTYEVEVARSYLYEPLPAPVKDNVVLLDRYWLTDEAASVYKKARAVISMECHSPIIATSAGRPGFYIRQPHDTWKGQMFPDLGLGDWTFHVDEIDGAEVAERLLKVHDNYDAAKRKVEEALAEAFRRYEWGMGIVEQVASRGGQRSESV